MKEDKGMSDRGTSTTTRRWWNSAKCSGQDVTLFDLESMAGYKGVDVSRDDVARELCNGCPVVADCALDALDPLAKGTVRAGVWIPLTAQTGRQRIAKIALLDKVGR